MSSKKGAANASSLIKLWINAGQATATPPIGPALGQRGVKAIDFCKQFNERTKDILPGTPLRVLINVRPDRTFNFECRPPTTSWFLKKAAGIEKGAGEPGREVAGTVSLKHIYEIARVKQTDSRLNELSLGSVCAMVAGAAKSMGILVVK
jgi:large subunit ribosomal protein L11